MTKVADFLHSLSLSADEIAVKARLPSARVRAILEGQEASLAELRALARALKVPLGRFGRAGEARCDLGMLFRTTAASRPDLGVEFAASFVQAAISILSPRSTAPERLSKFDFTEETNEEAERLADHFRLLFVPNRLDDPLFDLPDILVELGDVILGVLETSRFEGASVIADGYPFIFVSPRFEG